MLYWYECNKCKKIIDADPRGPKYDEISMEFIGRNTWVFKCYDCSSPEELDKYRYENVHSYP